MGEQTGQHIIGRQKPPVTNRVPSMPPTVAVPSKPQPVTTVTTLPANGSTIIHITPARPCALECVAELHVTMGHGSSMRVHLGDEQRRGLIKALGGTWPA